MDPGQRDVRRHRAERDRVVPDSGMSWYEGQLSVTSWVRGATAPSSKAWSSCLPKPSITCIRARRGLPPSTSTAPATSILPTPLRPAGATIGSFLVRNGRIVSSASERLPFGVDHGAAQLGAQHPGGAVRAETELVLQLQR